MLFSEKLRRCGLLGIHPWDFYDLMVAYLLNLHKTEVGTRKMFLQKFFWKMFLDAQLKNSDRVLQNFLEQVFCRTPTIRYLNHHLVLNRDRYFSFRMKWIWVISDYFLYDKKVCLLTKTAQKKELVSNLSFNLYREL